MSNDNFEAAELRYEVAGSAESGDVLVPARSQATFETDGSGTVRLFYQGRLVGRRASDGKPCP